MFFVASEFGSKSNEMTIIFFGIPMPNSVIARRKFLKNKKISLILESTYTIIPLL